MWLVMVPSARHPATETMSSSSRPDRRVDVAATCAYGDWDTQAVRSRSWVARSLTTPTSAIRAGKPPWRRVRSEEHTSELQSRGHLVCRLLLGQKKRGSA